MEKKVLKRITAESVNVPPLPQAVLKALQVVDDESAGVEDLERIISQEQVLAARVLRIANSAFIGLERRVTTLFDAVTLLGFNMVRALIIGAALRDIIKHWGSTERKLWEHCLGVSIGAPMIGAETGLARAEVALVAGLMHDVGKTVINNSVPEDFGRVVKRLGEDAGDSLTVEREVLGFDHCEVGAKVAKTWKFPPIIETVIRYHHLEPASESESLKKSDYKDLCRVVNLADDLCLSLGFGLRKIEGVAPGKVSSLGIPAERFTTLTDQFRTVFAEQRDSLMA
jgi:putative nucleotidyltransferase with HDIG domain